MIIYDFDEKIPLYYQPGSTLPCPISCGNTAIRIDSLILTFEDNINTGLIKICHALTIPRETFIFAFEHNFSDDSFLKLFDKIVFVGSDRDATAVLQVLGSNYNSDLWFDTETGLMRSFVYRIK